MSSNLSRRRNQQTLERLDTVESVIEERLNNGQRDLLGGGVPTAAIARETDITQETVSNYTRRLIQQGELVQVHGADPDTLQSRVSYLPTDHPDAPGGTRDGRN